MKEDAGFIVGTILAACVLAAMRWADIGAGTDDGAERYRQGLRDGQIVGSSNPCQPKRSPVPAKMPPAKD